MCVIFQVYKLKFLLGEALQNGCDTIIARASAVAASQLGLQCHPILAMDGKTVSVSVCAYGV